MNALVRQFEPLIRRAVGESIGLEVAFGHEPLVCEVDPSQLESALLNLAVNSRDAMPRGGTLTVTLKRVEHDDDPVRQNLTASPGPWIVLSLEDTGVAMPKEVVDRAFEPFFTTKELGKGSRLGLSRVYGFVQQSGGFVALASNCGNWYTPVDLLTKLSQGARRTSCRGSTTRRVSRTKGNNLPRRGRRVGVGAGH